MLIAHARTAINNQLFRYLFRTVKLKQVDILISKNQALQILTLNTMHTAYKSLWIKNPHKFGSHEN